MDIFRILCKQNIWENLMNILPSEFHSVVFQSNTETVPTSYLIFPEIEAEIRLKWHFYQKHNTGEFQEISKFSSPNCPLSGKSEK